MAFDRTRYMRRYRTVVQCHGCFEIFHYGHLKQLQEATKLGRLVVTITANKWITKPGPRIFTDEQRAEMLMDSRCVDKVLIVDAPDAESAIRLVTPDIYVKGKEYEGRLKEQAFCDERNIKVVFLGEKLFGSTELKSRLLPASS